MLELALPPEWAGGLPRPPNAATIAPVNKPALDHLRAGPVMADLIDQVGPAEPAPPPAPTL
jgi:hypothetical protein